MNKMSIFLIRHMLMMAIHQCSAELKISCYLNKGYTYNMNFCKSLFFFLQVNIIQKQKKWMSFLTQ